MPPKKREEDVDRLTRIAIVNKDKCKPKKCRQVRGGLFGGGGAVSCWQANRHRWMDWLGG